MSGDGVAAVATVAAGGPTGGDAGLLLALRVVTAVGICGVVMASRYEWGDCVVVVLTVCSF